MNHNQAVIIKDLTPFPEELAMSNMYVIEALIRILERKGIASKQEVLEELKVMKKEEKAKGN